MVAVDTNNKSWKYDQRLALEKFRGCECEVIQAFDSMGSPYKYSLDLEPDIVFFPKVIEGSDPFSITKFRNSLNCYVPYSTYGDNNPSLQYNRVFHNLLWKHYVATEIHSEISRKVSYIKSKNIVVSGYPGFDSYLYTCRNSTRKTPWPKDNRKKIIWAPHHTLESSKYNTNHSTFLQYHDFFKEMVDRFQDKVCFAFKPHPNLRVKLYAMDEWGQEMTEDYFNWWRQNESSLLMEGDYEDLFIHSDALIHDSVSFLAEYLCLGKPSCYLIKDESKLNKFLNKFGLLLLEYHTKVHSEDEISSFIESIISGESEIKNTSRVPSFLKVNEIASSEFIYKDIIDSIFAKN